MARRNIASYCGPAAIASALGVSRAEAAARLCEHEPRSRGIFHWPSMAKVLGIRNPKRPYWRVEHFPRGERPTLAAWLWEDARDAIVFVSRHFVHVKGGHIVEDNGWPCRRGRVGVVILIGGVQ